MNLYPVSYGVAGDRPPSYIRANFGGFVNHEISECFNYSLVFYGKEIFCYSQSSSFGPSPIPKYMSKGEDFNYEFLTFHCLQKKRHEVNFKYSSHFLFNCLPYSNLE